MRNPIHGKMTIDELFAQFPGKSEKLAQELLKTGMNCVGCCASTWETIEEGMEGHGFGSKETEALLTRLNAIAAEKEDLTSISLTEKAAKKYLSILAEEGKMGWGLRFSEKAAGCSGLEYSLEFSESARQDDAVFESFGVKIHVQKKSLNRLLGSIIDYVDGLQGSGFKISNPNVKKSCGCGNSHNY